MVESVTGASPRRSSGLVWELDKPRLIAGVYTLSDHTPAPSGVQSGDKKGFAMFAKKQSVGRLALLLAVAAVSSPRALFAQAAPAVSEWPLRVDSPAGVLTVYQPQPEKFEGDTLTARAAVSLTPPGATDPEFGAMWFSARVATDRDARVVLIQNIAVKQVKLPNATADQEQQFGQVVQQQVPPLNVTLSLDQLESTLGVVQKAKQESQQLDNQPPKILVTDFATILVQLDGDPKLQPAAGVDRVMRVVNTPFILLFDLDSKHYFLKTGATWHTASDLPAEWTDAGNVPANVRTAGDKLTPPPSDQPTPVAPPVVAGRVIVVTEPTEVISTDGPPTYTPLPGNDLLYLSNTQSDVFMDVATNKVFVLLGGRWYTAPNLRGPWTFQAADQLPAGFAQIPLDSPKAHVLVSVAGTQPAKDARLDAYIPQTTAIKRDSGSALTVSYDGDPQFTPIQNTNISYASNCVDPVLLVDNSYYCCHQAVWYHCDRAFGGRWVVADSVPQVIYTIPPSCPVYNCRYVYVYDSTPDVVYCGYLPGYTGCYVYGPTVVYGTGYRYPYWYRNEFIPRPVTFGYSPIYDSYAGTWGFSVGLHVDFFASGYGRSDWWGPQGYVDSRRFDDRRGYADNRTFDRHDVHETTNIRNVTVNRVNIYNRQENVTRNVSIRNDVHNTVVNNRTVNNNVHAENNVYAGSDGQVYRRTDKGWEARDSKGWSTYNGGNEPRANEHAETIPQHTPAANEDRRAGDHTAVTERESADRAAAAERDRSAQTGVDHARTLTPPAENHERGTTPARSAGRPAESARAPVSSLEEEHSARSRGGQRWRRITTFGPRRRIARRERGRRPGRRWRWRCCTWGQWRWRRWKCQRRRQEQISSPSVLI